MNVRSGLLVLGALALLHAPAAAESQNWQKSFDVGAMPVVRVQVEDARVHVHPGTAGKVAATVRYEARHWGFTGGHKRPEVTIEQVGGEVRVLLKEPSWVVVFGAVTEQIDVDVTVPDSCDLRVKTEDGSVRVEGPLAGRFDIATSDGRITCNGCRGDLRFTTRDGAVLSTGIDGVVLAETSDGRVELDGRFDVVSARTRDGRLRVVARPGSKMAGNWSLETRDDPLELLIPSDLKADLDARTDDGRIRFELPVTVPGGLSRDEVRGRINGGGPLLRVRSSDGSITLDVST